MIQIIINWSEDNPKLKCKSNYLQHGTLFNIGKEYKIYRIICTPTGEFIIFMLNEIENWHVTFSNSRTTNEISNIYDYFYGVDVILKKSLRKKKLENIEINN